MDDEALRQVEVATALQWAAGGPNSPVAGALGRELADRLTGLQVAVLVEGVSDQAAIHALAALSGRNLRAEGVSVLPMGGAMSVGRFLDVLGPRGLDVRLAGLCDAGEEQYVRRALERAGLGFGLDRSGMEALGFHTCVADLEEELIRALGVEVAHEVIEAEGELRAFRTFQRQPAQQGRGAARQIRRFLGTTSGRKAHYARALVERLTPAQVPAPLARLLADI